MKINCTKGTPEQMIAQFKKRIDELEGTDINSSFVYPEDMEALEDGEYESHVTEPINSSEDEIDEDLDPIYSDGEDWSIEYDGPEADDTSEFDEDEYNEWSEMPNVIDFELVDQKYVDDMDGFSTVYSMYRDLDDPNHFVFVFGDPDIYSPDDGNWDWECDNESEAFEWFESYTGFDDEEYDY